MRISTLLGIGLGGATLFAIAKAMNNTPTKQIQLSQTQIANNAGFVFYQGEYYPIADVVAQTSDLSITAYQAQQEIAANSRTGDIIELSIRQIDRITQQETPSNNEF